MDVPDQQPAGSESQPATIGLLEGLATTRAIRRYRPEPIPAEDIAKLLYYATRAPNGGNQQKWRFVVLGPDAHEARAVLGKAAKIGWDELRHVYGYDKGSALDTTSRKGRMGAVMERFARTFTEIPLLIIACAVDPPKKDHPTGAAGSVMPACHNLMLAARAMGYGGTLSTWQRHVEAELRDVLGIPDNAVMLAIMTLGRPEGHHGPVRRRPLTSVVYDRTWGNPPSWAAELDADPPSHGHRADGPVTTPDATTASKAM